MYSFVFTKENIEHLFGIVICFLGDIGCAVNLSDQRSVSAVIIECGWNCGLGFLLCRIIHDGSLVSLDVLCTFIRESLVCSRLTQRTVLPTEKLKRPSVVWHCNGKSKETFGNC